jgi:hypothetical protein
MGWVEISRLMAIDRGITARNKTTKKMSIFCKEIAISPIKRSLNSLVKIL